ncbi:MAG: quercetin dioxygenase-like cupin family protein [Polaribacter sp.]
MGNDWQSRTLEINNSKRITNELHSLLYEIKTMKKINSISINATNSKASFLCIIILIFSCKTDVHLPDPLEAGWKNDKVCEVLVENEKVRTLKCIFPPGVGHEKHFHAAHFGYTVSGSTFKITDKTGTREINVTTGSNFYNEKIEWHNVLNIGDSTAIFLIVEPK